MNPAEYDRIAELEETHWWYVGLRDLFSRLLKMPRFQLPSGPSVLDAGCGCGAHLQLLGDLLRPSYLGGFDVSGLAVRYAQNKAPQADVYESDLCRPEVHVDELNCILCCDVLYTTPLEEGVAGLKTLVERLSPGGLLLLHLPAYDWLKSRHDLAVHTKQRFTTVSTRRILTTLGLEVELLSYRMCVLFPAVALRRLPSLLRRESAEPEAATSDLQPVWASLNRVLLSALRWENGLIIRGCRLPWGSSIVAVGRKP